MTHARTWRAATAALGAGALLAIGAAPAVAQQAAPPTGLDGFAGNASAEGTTVFVGLPAELAAGLAPVLDALGVTGSIDAGGNTLSGIRIDLAQVEADLARAAAGEDVSSSSTALLTNLVLGSGAADAPGACTGGPVDVALPPDSATPLLTLTVLGVDCAATDERAFADVRIAGLDVRLAALLELGLPEEVADGAADLVATVNESLLTPASDGLCEAVDPVLAVVLPDAGPCQDGQPLLQLRDPFDLDVPVVDLDAVGASGEVLHDGGSLTATATSTFTGLNVLGIACVGGDDPPLTFASTATTDGATASRDASAPSLAAASCQSEQALLRLLLGDGPLGDVAVFEQIVQERLFDGRLQAVFDGVDDLLGLLSTQAITRGSPVLGDVDGAATSARTDPFVIASSIPLSALPGLGDTPVGDLAVVVIGGATEVGVDALPAVEDPVPVRVSEPAEPTTSPGDLPRTGGGGAAAVLGLAALAAAAPLHRLRPA